MGSNEFSPSGTLKDFDFMKEIEDIKEPCLITSGLLDLCSPLVAKQCMIRFQIQNGNYLSSAVICHS